MKAKRTEHQVGDRCGRVTLPIVAYDTKELSVLYWKNMDKYAIDSQWQDIVLAGDRWYVGRRCDAYKHKRAACKYES